MSNALPVGGKKENTHTQARVLLQNRTTDRAEAGSGSTQAAQWDRGLLCKRQIGRGDSVGPRSVIALQKEGKQWETGLISRASVQGKWMSPLQEKKNPRDYFLIIPIIMGPRKRGIGQRERNNYFCPYMNCGTK